MTGQISDEFLYRDEVYLLVAFNGGGLSIPEDFGMKAYSTCTACWRGYIMRYRIENGELLLDSVSINANDPVSINGVNPKETKDLFKYMYEGLAPRIKFTGSIMIAKDFIQSMYVHMGFQSPEAFKTVIELHMRDGDITGEKDLSGLMEERRKKGEAGRRRPRSDEKSDAMEWIERRFSLDHDSG